ncbi:hypothetical protein TNCV_3357941 [Trichonephila clavipes]|nr:hypothetical protein TNCV_3357941 [Trichonephila clavipes]
MRAKAYCDHSSIRDHWTMRCMSICPDPVVSLKEDIPEFWNVLKILETFDLTNSAIVISLTVIEACFLRAILLERFLRVISIFEKAKVMRVTQNYNHRLCHAEMPPTEMSERSQLYSKSIPHTPSRQIEPIGGITGHHIPTQTRKIGLSQLIRTVQDTMI